MSGAGSIPAFFRISHAVDAAPFTASGKLASFHRGRCAECLPLSSSAILLPAAPVRPLRLPARRNRHYPLTGLAGGIIHGSPRPAPARLFGHGMAAG